MDNTCKWQLGNPDDYNYFTNCGHYGPLELQSNCPFCHKPVTAIEQKLSLRQENIKARIGTEAYQKLEGGINARVDSGGSSEDEWAMADYLSLRFPPTTAEEISKKLEELSPPEPSEPPKTKRGTPDWIKLNR